MRSNEKMVRRHPHIFGDQSAETAGDVLRIWGEVKASEKAAKQEKDASLLGGVPRALPALVEAQQISSRAAGVGFDWENPAQVVEKLHEELREFEAAPAGRTRGRVRRHAVRAGEPGAVRQGGPGAGAAQDQCEVPGSASDTSSSGWRSAGRSRRNRTSRRWRSCGRKRNGNRDPAVGPPGGIPGGAESAEDHLGLSGCGTAAAAIPGRW